MLPNTRCAPIYLQGVFQLFVPNSGTKIQNYFEMLSILMKLFSLIILSISLPRIYVLPEVGQRLFTAKAIAWGRRLFVAQLLNNAVICQEYMR